MKKNSEHYIAHKGKKYIIEWYFDNKGKSPAQEYYQTMPKQYQKRLAHLFKAMCLMGQISNKQQFTPEPDSIFAFKPKPYRFFCFFVQGSKIIVTNAYLKKTDKLSEQDFEKSKKLRHDYIIRCEKGTYYE